MRPLPWLRYENTTINRDRVLIYCALLAPQRKQSLRSTSVRVGDTWSLKCSIARRDSQNRALRQSWLSLKQKAHFFLCKGICLSEAQRFCKNDSDSSLESLVVIRVESFCEKRASSHQFSQRDLSRVRVTKNRDSSRVIDLSHAITDFYCVERPVVYLLFASCLKFSVGVFAFYITKHFL